jgi:hypothetical protein
MSIVMLFIKLFQDENSTRKIFFNVTCIGEYLLGKLKATLTGVTKLNILKCSETHSSMSANSDGAPAIQPYPIDVRPLSKEERRKNEGREKLDILWGLRLSWRVCNVSEFPQTSRKFGDRLWDFRHLPVFVNIG